MNENRTSDAAAAVLPELTAERIDEIESAVFARIGADRHTARRSRRRGWLVAGTAAAAVAIVVAIAPVAGTFVSGGGAGGSAAAPAAPDVAVDSAEAGAAPELRGDAGTIAPVEAGREIITTATATLRVDDVADALAAIGATARSAGGYVEAMSSGGTDGVPLPIDGTIQPAPTDGGYITVRIPAADLQRVIDELAALGEVAASGVSRQDVTSQAIDLRARVGATQASVDRLTGLLAQAASVTDLIAAESALAERQATLESYQQQLEYLDDQVALSSLSVTVLPRTVAVNADPAGFTDGLAAGWNGLVAALNGVVVGIGFLLPWIAVVAVAGLVVWAVARLVRRGRRRTTPPRAASRGGADVG